MAILRKPYEISVWEDELIPEANGKPSYYKENKIMVIGTDEMTSPNKAFSPVLMKNVNGEVTLTFSMAYKYFDPASDSEVINPFIGYLINERKIKLFYDDEWYDFIIVDHQEDSESMVWQYTAKDALVNELSKNGYNIEFNTELGNNQGTAIELAKATLKNTDWQVDEENSDLLVQKVSEPMIRATLSGSLSVYDVQLKENVTLSDQTEFYVFYSYIANKEVKFVQFMREADKESFTYDDNENIIGKNYRILSDVIYDIVDDKVIGFSVGDNATISLVMSNGQPQYTSNQGYRIVYGPQTTYDPVMERTVERYEVANETDPENPYEIYKYTDSDYTTSNVVMPLVTSGSDFNIYENGTLQGWSNATLASQHHEDTGRNKFQHLELTSYPELKPGVPLVSLTDVTRIQGFLEMKFDGTLTDDYRNTYFNSGFEDNAGIIDHISGGEKFVLRVAAAKSVGKHKDLVPLDMSKLTSGIRAMVAIYTEPNGGDNYKTKDFYRQIEKKEDIILQFDVDDSNEWVLDNPTIIGGYFSESPVLDPETGEPEIDQETGEIVTAIDYKNYIINNVVQEPTTNSVYKVEGDPTEYVWDSANTIYVEKTSTNFIDYYYLIAKATKPITNTRLTDPTFNIGIFVYTLDEDLCASDVYTYISDIQITRCVLDANNKPITIGNIPTTTVTETSTYYIKPKEGATKEEVDVFYTPGGVAQSIGKQASDITPVYNEKSEKILSISEAQSNCFNILQTICETFECWLKIEAERNPDGGIKAGTKKVLLKEYAGKDNFAGFKYAINLKSIQRTLNSEEIVTKLIVDNVQSDYTDDGVMSIRNASSNPSGEAYILNLSYYINKGLIKNGQDCKENIATYYAEMKRLNTQLNQLRAEKAKLELALNKLNSDRNVYTELISAAKDQYNEGMVDFKKATGMDYNDYVEEYGTIETIVSVAPIKPSDIDRTVMVIPTRSLIPTSNNKYRYYDSIYGFGKYGENTAYYADQYKQDSIKKEPTVVFQVRDEGPSNATGIGTDGTQLYLREDNTYYSITIDGNNSYSLLPSEPSGVTWVTEKGSSNTVTLNELQYYYTVTHAGVDDQEKVEVIGMQQTTSNVYRLFEFEAGAWVEKETWDSTPSGSDENVSFWNLAIANASDEDHGASDLQGITLPLKLDEYGYCYTEGVNYLAVRLAFKDNVKNKQYNLYSWNTDTSTWDLIYSDAKAPSVDDEPDYHDQWKRAAGNFDSNRHGETTLNNGDLTDHEAIIDIIGQLYVASSTINNYAGILSNLNQEYDKLKLQVNGAIDYIVTVNSNDVVEENNQTYRYSRLMLSDYIDGNDSFKFYFHKSKGGEEDRVEYQSGVSVKNFEVYDFMETEESPWHDRITITTIPEHYTLEEINPSEEEESDEPAEPQESEESSDMTIVVIPQSTKNYRLTADSTYKAAHPGLQKDIDKFQQQKDDCEKAFYSKYAHYIKEGTWSSNDYVDAELYYLDALQTSANSAMPKVEYSIDVAEVSELEGLENYIFDVGDKTYVEDTEFFGWHGFFVDKITNEVVYTIPEDKTIDDYDFCKQPAREEVIVSQVEWHLDEPETNVITVQNYKTRFEDLFQRLSATVQQVQYNEATYAKTSSILDENGTLNQNLLVDALNTVRGSAYALTSDGSVAINGDQIWIRDIQNLTNSQNIVRINSEGIGVSTDAGQNWTTAINGRGINAGLITVGNLNADEVTILDGNNPSFRWDKYGISAYRYQGADKPYDLTNYVRLDQYGLYGVKGTEDYHATSLDDVKRQAQFGLTWDGFFIKNSYEGGGLVQITSDNDFQVINSAQTEKIKIGALEWTSNGVVTTTPVDGLAPSLYGIRINNDAGETVFKTGDDGNITITGTINALGGNFTGIVNVGPEDDDHIVIDGENAVIKSSNYNGEVANTGWMIDKNGDAVFTNITARGAIKTAVFEYAEIQAVGGVFLFRPSSTIKEARVSGNDLILKVEKPFLFAKVSYTEIYDPDPNANPQELGWYEKTNYGYQETTDITVQVKQYYSKNEVTNGSWCKVSNYTADGVATDAGIQNILLTNGLTHVYQVTAINTTTKEITLSGAAVMVTGQNPITTLAELEGGALVDMGRKDGSSNYGIGVNSSDNTVNLPRRAISLFETEIDETQEPKITYKYRGILGTLPELPATSVNTEIYNNMVGTQGIYTDNMYLGDLNQFLAFYTDRSDPEHPKKRLRICASQVMFEMANNPGHYEDVADIEAEGVPGPPGENAITVQIDSSAGNLFYRQNVSSTLTCTVYSGTEDITNQVTKFTWKKKNSDGTIDPTWTRLQGGRTISINPNDVESKAIFICEVEF